MVTLRPGEMGGSETYARSLASALAREGTLQYVCLVPAGATDAAGGLPVVPVSGLRGGAWMRVATLAAAAARGPVLARRLRGVRAMHFPFTVPVPRLGAPWAVTIHDLLHREFPALVPRAFRAFRSLAYDRAARVATLVLVPSDYVRGRVIDLLGVAPDRLRTVPHGVDHERFEPAAEPAPREPFLVYPARRWPHKNHDRLLAAFALVRRQRPDLRLVLTGGGPAPPTLPEGVEWRGPVAPDELAGLYRRAAALVFPSLHEGFGLPALEAMACGCPVACSATTSLPEVCGDAAVYFDPYAPDDIAAAALRAVDDVERLVPLGLERARAFTWDRSARSHEDAYRVLLAGS